MLLLLLVRPQDVGNLGRAHVLGHQIAAAAVVPEVGQVLILDVRRVDTVRHVSDVVVTNVFNYYWHKLSRLDSNTLGSLRTDTIKNTRPTNVWLIYK